jgi:hypothetical protein
VLDRVHVVRAGPLEESLKVLYLWPCLVLDAAYCDRDTLHVGAVCLLVIVDIKDGCGHDPLRAPLSPLLIALDILLGALDNDGRWHHLAATKDYLPTA